MILLVRLLLFGAITFAAKVPPEPPNALFVPLCERAQIFIKQDGGLFSSSLFDKNEKLLICGAETPGWQNVPVEQAAYHARIFLSKKGYFQPSIFLSANKLEIDPGSLSYVRSVEFRNTPREFSGVTYRGAKGRVLQSSLLDEVEVWSLRRLKAIGYPCPKVKVRASYKEGQVLVDVFPGRQGKLMFYDRTTKPEQLLDARALSRYDAIEAGDVFNGDYLLLTSRRLMNSGIAGYAFFEDFCTDADQPLGSVHQKVTAANPNYLVFGFGASTEEFPLLKLSWTYSLIDRRGTSLQMKSFLSLLRQSIQSELNYFPLSNLPRFSLVPRIKVERRNENIFTAVFQQYAVAGQYQFDLLNHQLILRFAPTYNIERTKETSVNANNDYLSFATKLLLQSHYYELYMQSPRSGHSLLFEWDTLNKGLNAENSANKISIRGSKLWNIGLLDPPVFVLGTRFHYQWLETSSKETVPQSVRIYLGGDDNIRGFGRNALNNDKLGYFNAFYLGLEGRFVDLLPWRLQPLLFFDIAKVGVDSITWFKPIFLAPGLGMRWESPIGTFRTTLAHGFIGSANDQIPNIDQEITFFLSFGKEF